MLLKKCEFGFFTSLWSMFTLCQIAQCKLPVIALALYCEIFDHFGSRNRFYRGNNDFKCLKYDHLCLKSEHI